LFGELSNTLSLDTAVVDENAGVRIAPVLHPSIVLVTAHVTMTGAVLSIAVSVWVTLIVFPHASVTRYILVAIYGLAAHPAPPLFVLLNNVTVGVLQLSASVVTISGSGAGISAIHCTDVGAGLLAVGGVLSIAVIVCVTLTVFPQASVTRYILVAMNGLAGHPAPPLFVLLNNVTVGVLQLSASLMTTSGSGAGTLATH
jgi:hypothetical protein